MAEEVTTKTRIERIRKLASKNSQMHEFYEAASIAQSLIHDTVGGGHPLMRALDEAIKSSDWFKILGACNSVLALYDEGALPSPSLRIAHEIEGSVLDIAQIQVQLAETTKDATVKQMGLAIAAFLAGATLEDALRRLCDTNEVAYDPQRSTVAKLQGVLYQPAKNIEVISQSENKQITAWGDTRNKADHGRFSEITQTEVVTMVIGVRAFIDKHLP